MRLLDQPAVLEWFPTGMKAIRRNQPLAITRQRRRFETGEAAVRFATSTLPEAFRHNATLMIADVPPFSWEMIEAMGKTLAERGE